MHSYRRGGNEPSSTQLRPASVVWSSSTGTSPCAEERDTAIQNRDLLRKAHGGWRDIDPCPAAVGRHQ